MKYAHILPDLSVRVCTRSDGRDGGWTTDPFPAHWLARKWVRLQGYTLVESMPTWEELCRA